MFQNETRIALNLSMPINSILGMEEEQKERFKRRVALERKISEVRINEDVRVKIVGRIISKDDKITMFVLDDGESKANIIVPDQKMFESIQLGKIIRVIGIVLPAIGENNFEIRAEIIQDMSRLDLELYNQYMKLRL